MFCGAGEFEMRRRGDQESNKLMETKLPWQPLEKLMRENVFVRDDACFGIIICESNKMFPFRQSEVVKLF